MFVFECFTHEKHSLVMFLGQYTKESKNRVIGSVQSAYKTHLTPEVIFLIYPKYLEREIDTLLSDISFKTDVYRYEASHIYKVSFDREAKFQAKRLRKGKGAPIKLVSDHLFEDIKHAGLEALMSNRSEDVIVKAPSGTTFVKPSGKTLEEFIYASQLARNSFENQFIAMCTLRYAPDLKRIDSIYIDTSSISAIAESIIYYTRQFLGSVCKHITYASFSSYSGLEENIRPDNVGGTWVIISASASTSMGQTLVSKWTIDPRQVVTILSYKPSLSDGEQNIGNQVVFCIDKYSNRVDKNSFPTKVQVQGESFSAEVSVPDKIVIRKKYKPGYVTGSIYNYRKGNTFSAQRDGRSMHVSYTEMRKCYLDASGSLDKEKELYQWIQKTVEWSIPRNLGAVICDQDPESQALLRDFLDAIDRCNFDLNAISIIDFDKQDAMERIGDGAVLVLSPAVSTGHIFVDANRSLRLSNHTGMRTFATPFVVAPSEKQLDSVIRSLTEGVKGFRYNYVKYKTIFFNNKGVSCWDKELEVIRKVLNDKNDESELFWEKRKEILESKSSGLLNFVGIHSVSPSEHLKIAGDFVFWPHGYNLNEVNQSAVYATVGCVLQNIRDNLIDGAQLSANIYKHAVLDPENFVRFNDPILQSCLWRCALPGELDYRRSDQLSGEITRILTKIFQASNSDRGVASIDLLMCIATRWIKVSSDELTKILHAAEEHLKCPHAAPLIEFIRNDFSRKI